MKKHLTHILLVSCLVASANAFAAKPKAGGSEPVALVPVTEAEPLRFSAPADWEIHVHPPQKKTMAAVATLSQSCINGEVHTLFIQLDDQFKTPEALISDQLPQASAKKTGTWVCAQGSDHEALCAGRVKGLKGIVAVYLGSMNAAAFESAGGQRFAAKVAASVSWKAGTVDKIPEWSRSGAPAIDVKCPD